MFFSRTGLDNFSLKFHCSKFVSKTTTLIELLSNKYIMAFRTTAIARNASKWAYNLAGFNKYGLLRDDCLHETPDVTEALRRLPQHVVDERNFRMVRAIQLSMQKTILPKEEWTKLEDDKLYLSPIVEQVKKERLEREQWEKNY